VRDKDLRTLVREMQVMKLLNHRNVVRLYEIIDTPDAFYLVLEVCAAMRLFRRTKAVPFPTVFLHSLWDARKQILFSDTGFYLWSSEATKWVGI
jgi:serine/threonine protein kinase